jgi:hypothetical protein
MVAVCVLLCVGVTPLAVSVLEAHSDSDDVSVELGVGPEALLDTVASSVRLQDRVPMVCVAVRELESSVTDCC